jgi:hypothetical protein
LLAFAVEVVMLLLPVYVKSVPPVSVHGDTQVSAHVEGVVPARFPEAASLKVVFT